MKLWPENRWFVGVRRALFGLVGRTAAGAVLIMGAGRLLIVYSAILFAEYEGHAAQPEMYLSAWPDITRYSAIALASVPLALLCAVRLIRRGWEGGDQIPGVFDFVSDCSGLYAVISFLQFIAMPRATGYDPLLESMKDSLILSVIGGAWGAWCTLVVVVFMPPLNRLRALRSIIILAIFTASLLVSLILKISPNNQNLQFWTWVSSIPTSAFLGASALRLRVRHLM
jgi:hypothetical protein